MTPSCYVCGTFPDPTNRDKGQSEPYRIKGTCEAYTLPSLATFSLIYNPETQMEEFRANSNIFDSFLDEITDENGDQISGDST